MGTIQEVRVAGSIKLKTLTHWTGNAPIWNGRLPTQWFTEKTIEHQSFYRRTTSTHRAQGQWSEKAWTISGRNGCSIRYLGGRVYGRWEGAVALSVSNVNLKSKKGCTESIERCSMQASTNEAVPPRSQNMARGLGKGSWSPLLTLLWNCYYWWTVSCFQSHCNFKALICPQLPVLTSAHFMMFDSSFA